MSDAVVGDLLDSDSLRVACEGIETIYHCAGYAHAFSSSDLNAHWRINYEGTCNLLRAAGAAGVRRFIFLSSVKAMANPGAARVDEHLAGEPSTPYGKAKRAAEEAVLEAGARFGMHVVNLRLAMVYGRGGRGNLERMARGIRTGWFPPLPETGNRRSLLHVDDAAAAMHVAAASPDASGKTYIVADDTAYSGRALYDAIREALQLPSQQWAIPATVLRRVGIAGDIVGRWTSRSLPMNSEAVSRLLDSAWYSPERIQRELGWRAKVSLAAGIREMLGVEASS